MLGSGEGARCPQLSWCREDSRGTQHGCQGPERQRPSSTSPPHPKPPWPGPARRLEPTPGKRALALPTPPAPVRPAPRVPGRHDTVTRPPRPRARPSAQPRVTALDTRACWSGAATRGVGGDQRARGKARTEAALVAPTGPRPGRARAAHGARRPSARFPSPGQVCHDQSVLSEKARGAVMAQPCVRPRARSLSAARRLVPGPKGFGASVPEPSRGSRAGPGGCAGAEARARASNARARSRPTRARPRIKAGDAGEVTPRGLLCRSTGHRQSPSRPCNHAASHVLRASRADGIEGPLPETHGAPASHAAVLPVPGR